jgi:hypothetical protein
MFFDLLNNLGMGNIVQPDGFPQHQQHQNGNKPPPASSRAIDKLPVVKVTADDLIEETNKECVVCLELQTLGTLACKLPCGHLFHKECVASWLQKHCTCPVCRFELETDDAQYEAQRQARMKNRKLRVRLDELQTKKVGELKEICRRLGIEISNCVDKHEIVERISRSGKVVITQGVPPIEMTKSEFHAKSISELKKLLLSFGISSDGVLEKAELKARLFDSGRIIVLEDNNIEEQQQDSQPMVIDEQSNDNDSNNDNHNHGYTVDSLQQMSLSALKELCREHHIDMNTCVDKWELVERIVQSGKVPLDHRKSPPSSSSISATATSTSPSLKSSSSQSLPIFPAPPPVSSSSTSTSSSSLYSQSPAIPSHHSTTATTSQTQSAGI